MNYEGKSKGGKIEEKKGFLQMNVNVIQRQKKDLKLREKE